MFAPYIAFFQNENVQIMLKFLWTTSIYWFPALCLFILWEYWVRWRQALYQAKKPKVLLEIRLPREIFKSPAAAEFFINSLYQTTGEKNWFELYWKGQVRSNFALEIVSIEGAIHFFVWAKVDNRPQLEANLYSQYPGIEVNEVPDYTLPISYNPEVNSFWVGEFELAKEDVFPIKTYVDYGMDKDPKEEYKVDPLTPLLEFMGSVQKGTQIWIQILIRQHKPEHRESLFGKKTDKRWKDDAQAQIDKIVAKAKGEKDGEGKLIPGTVRQLTEVEKETVQAIGRSISKNPFDVGIRAIYFAPKDVFQITNVGGIVGGITHFNSHLNGFKPVRTSDERYSNFFIAWLPRRQKKRDKEYREMLDAYKHRGYFYRPFKSPHFVLNAEELATIFHFPGATVSSTPTFTRIDSRKSEAPSNLPV